MFEPETGAGGAAGDSPEPAQGDWVSRLFGRDGRLVVAAVAGVVILGFLSRPGGPLARHAVPSSDAARADGPSAEWLAHEDARLQARQLRMAAHADCEASRWAPCLDELEQARQLNPAGEGEPSVQADRRVAVGSLPATPGPGR